MRPVERLGVHGRGGGRAGGHRGDREARGSAVRPDESRSCHGSAHAQGGSAQEPASSYLVRHDDLRSSQRAATSASCSTRALTEAFTFSRSRRSSPPRAVQ